MATNHTTNYALNLWEPTDSFVREEFNENTSKIDEALRNLRPYVIKHWVTEEDATSVEIDISDIQWKNYSWVIFEAVLPQAQLICLSVNGGGLCSGAAGCIPYIMMSERDTDSFRMFCPVFYRDDLCLKGFNLSGAGNTAHTNLPCKQLTTLTLEIQGYSSDPRYIKEGTEITIMGMK